MAEHLDPNDLVTLQELALSNMWETAALIEVLEKKDLLTKQDILDAIRELRQKNPLAKTPLGDYPPKVRPPFPVAFRLPPSLALLKPRVR
ncbi:MAG: hypothetical protein O6840_05840 [Nitrospirae bacterium]|nr:hypothetical protein [Nitrospirota bacterium]